MATNQIIASNPPTVWQVPETFKSVYSHAVEVRDVNRLLMISGQFGVTPDEHLAADFATQCEQAIDNVAALLAASGMTTSNIAQAHLLRDQRLQYSGACGYPTEAVGETTHAGHNCDRRVRPRAPRISDRDRSDSRVIARAINQWRPKRDFQRSFPQHEAQTGGDPHCSRTS